MKNPTESTTWFWIRKLNEEAIEKELEEVASNFEIGSPDGTWTGREIAEALRGRIAYRKGE